MKLQYNAISLFSVWQGGQVVRLLYLQLTGCRFNRATLGKLFTHMCPVTK